MTLLELTTEIAQFLLVLISLITSIDFLRHRDRPRLDIALMFATLGIPSFISIIQELLDQQSGFLGILLFILVFAHPYMMLRLVRHFESLSPRITRAAFVGFIFSASILLVVLLISGDSEEISPAILLVATAAILYFILVEGYVAMKFIRGAIRTSGLTRHRLRFLGAGSGFLAGIFVVLILSVVISFFEITLPEEISSGLSALFTILLATSYFLGLTPPAFIRRFWQLNELQLFLDKMNLSSIEQPSQQLLDTVNRAAVRAVGGNAGSAAFWNNETNDFLLRPPIDYQELAGLHIPDGGQIGRSWRQQTPILVQETADLGPGDKQAAAQVNAKALAIIPVRVLDQPYCIMLIFFPNSPLFPTDDLALLNLFANQVSLTLAFAPLLEQERKLVKELREKTTQLQEARDTLEQRVQERTNELAAVNAELKQFTYIVSHDLRSPLVNIKGFISELDMSVKDVKRIQAKIMPLLDETDQQILKFALNQDIPEAMDFINTAASRMDSLVRALLDLGRLGRRPLNIEEISLNQIVADTLKTLAHVVEEKGVHVQVDSLPPIHADLLSFEQIFANLLTNAVNYLDPERQGQIKISATETPGVTTIHIQDNGIGIKETDHEKIFAPFRRGDNNIPGEGMGLAYVQALVRRHNGRITFESEPGVGTTFHFTIPEE